MEFYYELYIVYIESLKKILKSWNSEILLEISSYLFY